LHSVGSVDLPEGVSTAPLAAPLAGGGRGAVVAAVLVNEVRISILALLVTLPAESGMPACTFFHDSMGGLLFSIVSVVAMGWCHTTLIDRVIARLNSQCRRLQRKVLMGLSGVAVLALLRPLLLPLQPELPKLPAVLALDADCQLACEHPVHPSVPQ
jgi:hypothetical protein